MIVAVARERRTNDLEVDQIRWAFRLLLLGLGLITIEAATLAGREVF
ncbi:hypothetical protein Gocc_1251 [Gaiella occulta]|uniref:Uncharacterized protein n=1 Tax=Gaiella occulta TaxID=1002870 RepID=A0A7M2Z103_9ACTN|nr:hypothetical protein [Gaiella occulta]RDI75453.1 hypothetical protein Gocc_1251 [Gaiella occulta]